jgi:hypothetical protein
LVLFRRRIGEEGEEKEEEKKKNNKSNWKIEYYDKIYKVYDWNKNLAGYFFPTYNLDKEEDTSDRIKGGQLQQQEEEEEENEDYDDEDEIIEEMNKSHGKINGGQLMLPMVKLNLLDNKDGMDLDYTIQSLELNLQRTKTWKQWIETNHLEFGIIGIAVYTAREDRNMLSIVLYIDSYIILGEKEIGRALSPLLNKLHEDGML